MMASLNFTFVNFNKHPPLMSTQIIHGVKICNGTKNSREYIKLQNFPTFFKWLECKVKDTMSNLMEWFNNFNKRQDKLDCGGGGIVG
jgi:hypothetical protein